MNLESLNAMSTDSLLEMAARIGLELPNGLERPFIIEEILENDETEGTEAVKPDPAPAVAADSLPAKDGAETQEGFPSRYNENQIAAILKDPSWAYLYWDIRQDERGSEIEPRSFLIRVLELAGPQDQAQNALSWFEFAVSPEDCEWFVNLPEDGVHYVFELSVQHSKDRRLLARSNVIQAPRARTRENFEHLPRRTKELLELSGLFDCVETPILDGHQGRILPLSGAET